MGKKSGLFCYILTKTADHERIIAGVSEKLSLQPQIIEDAYFANGKKTPQPKIEEWLSNILNADFVITDSFHGTCFCLMFNKPFIAVCDKNLTLRYRSPERLQSILSLTGLEERLVFDFEDCEKLLQSGDLLSVNWNDVNAKLAAAKEQSLQVLDRTIAPLEQKRGMSDYDLLMEYQVSQLPLPLKRRVRKLLKKIYQFFRSQAGRAKQFAMRQMKRMIGR